MIMKNYLCKSILVLLVAANFFSCKKDDVERFTPPLNDNSLPATAVSGISINNKSSKEIIFTTLLAVFKDSKNMEYQLTAKNFEIDTLNGDFAFAVQSAPLTGGGNAGSYSSLMLMDQSGSISGTDPQDFRLDAAKIFTQNLGSGNNAWLWSFEGSKAQSYGTGFTSDTSVLLPQIENLRDNLGGNTPLYNSQYLAVEAASTKGDKSNKAVLTFTDGMNNVYNRTSTQVSDFAKSKNVQLFNIGLGAVDASELLSQAVAANGAFMYAKDARQLISMFGNLGKLLDKSARFYAIQWKASAIGSNSFPNTGLINTTLFINTPYDYTIEVPVIIRY